MTDSGLTHEQISWLRDHAWHSYRAARSSGLEDAASSALRLCVTCTVACSGDREALADCDIAYKLARRQ